MRRIGWAISVAGLLVWTSAAMAAEGLDTPAGSLFGDWAVQDVPSTDGTPAPSSAPQGGSSTTATVNGDVDVYDVPGGVGTVIGMLEKGKTVTLVTCRKDDWCQIADGHWVWGEFLDH